MGTPADTEIAYLAGLFDGEGCVFITRSMNTNGKRYHQMKMTITNTNREVLEWVAERFGGNIYKNHRTASHTRQPYRVEWQHADQVRLLTLMHPYLIIKRRVAELGLEFRATIRKEKRGVPRLHVRDVLADRERIHAEMVTLNGGKPSYSHLAAGTIDEACRPREFCKRGHPLTEATIKGGKWASKRACGICARENNAALRARKKAEAVGGEAA